MIHQAYLARLAALRERYHAGELSHHAYLKALDALSRAYQRTLRRADKEAA